MGHERGTRLISHFIEITYHITHVRWAAMDYIRTAAGSEASDQSFRSVKVT